MITKRRDVNNKTPKQELDIISGKLGKLPLREKIEHRVKALCKGMIFKSHE